MEDILVLLSLSSLLYNTVAVFQTFLYGEVNSVRNTTINIRLNDGDY